MKKILIFAGTTEGRKLSECLSAAQIEHTLCVATQYGETALNGHTSATVHRGRMKRDEMAEYIRKGGFAAVVDATHPYAVETTENIRAAMQGLEIPYLRLKRETGSRGETEGKIYRFDTMEACAKALEKTDGNILLTVGSKNLNIFCASEEVKNRLYVRTLPSVESITMCLEQGIKGNNILALQGPFTVEMNEAVIRQYRIGCLVTKESGSVGGYQAKLEAAQRTDIPVLAVGNSKEDTGFSFGEVCRMIGDICGKTVKPQDRIEIVLVGVGMGDKSSLTREVQCAVESADVIFGAERMIAQYRPRIEKKPYYKAEQIIPYIHKMQENLASAGGKVVVLFSGDTGFYSGCRALYEALRTEINLGRLNAFVHIMPGISSIAYLAACIGESYQDAAVYSMHEKKLSGIANRIRKSEKNFLLMSGVEDVRELGKALLEAQMYKCGILAGYMLSYPEQRIMPLTPEECCDITDEGLYTCFVRNPYAKRKKLTHGKADADFIREDVPMTKEEVREVSICKLKLYEEAVVYDIGSGTGSIAAEIAGLSDDIQVYAIERKAEAASLIEKNKKKFCLENITVVAAEAPDGIEGLPVPTHAFIGGSGGRLKEILSALYGINPEMRIVINAVSMETICEIKEILHYYPIQNEDIVQMQISRAKRAGGHRLMLAENPVWICAFDFCPKGGGK